ncbi:MAG: archaemetzincin [Candidatus Lokiarchaeota archaeon]|nr:archaemetzincin [Candidatus Lokiarchaeota archaeon]
MKHKIYLQKIGLVDKSLLVKLKRNLEWSFKRFGVEFKICSNDLALYKFEYVSGKKQFDGALILKRLMKQAERKNHFRILGVIDQDIFFEFYNYNFGVAKFPEAFNTRLPRTALISIFRLKETNYEREDNPALLEKRTLTESVHELGHTFGLGHCDSYCVMQFSDSLMLVDKKTPNFCDKCMGKLDEVFLNLD